MQLQDRVDEFAARDTVVVAVAQEDESLEEFARMQASGFEGGPRFELVCDANRARTGMFDRTTAYLIDREGIVRQVFPMTLRHRPAWEALLAEVDELE